MRTNGIHHITAISGPDHRTDDFYTRILGLRRVKTTVNFDDPTTHHLYYGDAAGRPGTILTFFPYAHAALGRMGIGELQETVLAVPEQALGFWSHRLLTAGVQQDSIVRRFGETVLPFRDPDGMRLALVAAKHDVGSDAVWTSGEIDADHAIRGIHSASLLLKDGAATADVLTDVFGMTKLETEGTTTRYGVAGGGLGTAIDIRAVGDFLRGRPGAGTVHHIAFRAADDAEQEAMVAKLAADHGLQATEQRDRNYFRSVYFREPGGVLFEIATDEPGFAVDEPSDALGATLKLPSFLEGRRAAIEARLPSLDAEAHAVSPAVA
ncbi:ring-cleaving dioxygenase [Antarcticirhabdus aurantiaca]|uniref:Ring-cleaving dioxygenase n=1 Tax=Antarcticirhabdus aurantiaca TaxID=2606717 RepID=A0ACD4NHI8_9HYPH|nr:ring-cleaving dioxygenase [Antarcticirhabdus aurantiaca]WAJ26264.1 ring-cleaving dioxygenase [Jeongeuplla avenae]